MSITPPSGPAGRGRRRPLFWLLLVAFVLVPLAEIYVLVQVGQVIGAGWTIVLLIADSVIGGWILRREGARAWRSLREALQVGRMPATEIADGALIVVGGTLMLAPGFVSDVLGLLLILPLTRPLFRRLLAAAVARRLVVGGVPGALWGVGPAAGAAGGPTRRRPGPGGPVVRGEVVDDVGDDVDGPAR